tara:strand:+ start:726 stop:1010 length:285 start_codon:yes stop_codon:yes gene_type:complete
MIELRSFDKADWYAWNGCESSHPLIAELDRQHGTMMTIIIDDCDAAVYDHGTSYDDFKFFNWKFPSRAIATLAVMSLVGQETVQEIQDSWSQFV